MGKPFRTEYEPQDFERDPNGNFHSTYFHVACGHDRYAAFDATGFSQETLRSRGLATVAKQQSCEFFAPIRRGDRAVIETWVERIGTTSICFRHDVCRASDGTLAARAQAVTVIVSLETGKAAKVPEDFAAALAQFFPDKEQ